MMKHTKIQYGSRIFFSALSLALAIGAFSGLGCKAAQWLKLQAAPLFQRTLGAFSLGSLALLLALVFVTWLFGRFYCAILCPLGLWQDLAGSLRPRSGTPLPPLRRFRYAIAALFFGAAAGGWCCGLLVLDPYANFGRMIRPFTAGGAAVLIALTAAAVWKKRLFCAFICPVGTWLGVAARHAVFQLTIGEECVRCGRCVRRCPAGCIDVERGTIDNERCVRCLGCLAVCPKEALHWVRKSAPQGAGRAISRRQFLADGGLLLAGTALGVVLIRSAGKLLQKMVPHHRLLPPGAGSPERFAFHCTGCQLCAAVCPEKIIVPAPGGFGPVSLDLDRGFCRYDCHRCTQVCPTGAIPPLSLAVKQKTRLGEAHFDARHCLVFQEDEACGRCAEACPTHAVTLRKNGTPRPVKTALCLGCGACRAVCPAPVKAYIVTPR